MAPLLVMASIDPQILVVEDNPDGRELLLEWLDASGFAAAGAENGSVALALLRQGVRPRLILLDLMMPVMDGWAFMRAARSEALLCGVTIWAVSAAEHLAPPEGLDGFFPKPVDLDRLRKIVEQFATGS